MITNLYQSYCTPLTCQYHEVVVFGIEKVLNSAGIHPITSDQINLTLKLIYGVNQTDILSIDTKTNPNTGIIILSSLYLYLGKMHPYIPHLLSDITAAHRTESPEPAYPKTIEEEFEEMERWMKGEEPLHTFGYHCGLTCEQFPPCAQLTKKELKLVCKAFSLMMLTWNLSEDLPVTLPPERYYELLISTLDMKTDIVNSGFIGFEFCPSYPPECIFKEYCTCLKFWNTEDDTDA